jgi:methylated-DNA-[protein]-cysteine S-methyltransferase
VNRKPHIFYDTLKSPFGTLYLVFSGNRLVEIQFGGQTPLHPKGKVPELFKEQMNKYFSGVLKEISQDIVFLHGTAFEQAVWLCLREIPYGETRSYKWVAEKVGNPKAVRAVGQALSKNPVPIVLPCHRVIESDGSIGGYSSGVDIKRRLLDLEYYNREVRG